MQEKATPSHGGAEGSTVSVWCHLALQMCARDRHTDTATGVGLMYT